MKYDWIDSVKYSAEQIAAAYDDGLIGERCKNLKHHYMCSYSGIFETAAEDCDIALPKGIAYRVCSIACLISTRSLEDNIPLVFLETLSRIVLDVSAPAVRAHFYDVLWVYGRKHFSKPIEFARKFVLEVSKLPLNDESWSGDQYGDFWRRAVELSVLLGAGVGNESAILYAVLKAEYANAVLGEGRLLAWAIPHIFYDYKVYDVISPKVFAMNYENLAVKALSKGENCYAQTHYNDAKGWYHFTKSNFDVNRMIVGNADACVREAESEASKENPSWGRVGAFYDMAISAYMSVPNSERGKFAIDEKMRECQKYSDNAHAKALKQMKTIQGPPIDISDDVKNAGDCVRQKTFKEALRTLCLLYSVTERQAESHAKRTLGVSTIPFLMGKTVLGPNARPVASAPEMSLDAANKDGQSRLSLEKISATAELVQYFVVSRLYPAYEVIKAEHKDAWDEIKSLVDEAPLIPHGHIRVYAEALWLGFDGQFTMASYVLAPEIENLIREALNQSGIITTSMQDGFQEEKGLSRLVKEEKLVGIFDADFVFELNALFCDHAGPNIRNVVAHGLKDDSWFNTSYDFYVWWFALRMVFMRSASKNNL